MRILIVHNLYQDPGGEDAVFRQETEALKENHNVDTLIFQNKKGLGGLFQFLFYPYNIFAARVLRKKIKAFKPDIIHVHNIHYASGPILFRVAKRYQIPIVFTLHNYRLICPSANLFYKNEIYLKSIGSKFPWDAVKKGVLDDSILKTFWVALVYKLHRILGTWEIPDRYLVLNSEAKKLLLSGNLGVSPLQVTVKPNFIEAIPFKKGQKQDYFLFIGRLAVEKGIIQLLKSFTMPEMPGLKILGDGPLRSEVLRNKSENIEFLGFREDTREFLSTAKGVIIPSIWYEGLPMVLLEALAAGTPVIISKIVIASEWIEDSKSGFIIDSFDFSEKIKEVSGSNNLDKISEEGLKLFNKYFSKEIVMKQLEDIYTDSIGD